MQQLGKRLLILFQAKVPNKAVSRCWKKFNTWTIAVGPQDSKIEGWAMLANLAILSKAGVMQSGLPREKTTEFL